MTTKLIKNGVIKTFKVEDGRCVTTIELSGKWVSNPTLEMMRADGWEEYVAPAPTPDEILARAKAEKIAAIMAYDASSEVTGFILAGRHMWIKPDERTNYLNTMEGAARLGVESVPFMGMIIRVTDAISMLDAINIYAMQTCAVTDAHKAAVMALDTIEAVEAYDNTVGYPPMLNFDEMSL